MSEEPTPASASPLSEWESHLDELRRRIICVLVVFFVTTLCAFTLSEYIAAFLTAPLASLGVKLYAFSPTEKFMAHLHISALTGLVFTLPFFLLQAGFFIWPGLRGAEKRYAAVAVIAVPVLFLAGAAAAYNFFAPVAMRFFLNFAAGDGVEPLWGLREYLSLLACLMLGAGIMLQMPLALLALFALGIASPQKIARQRPYAILLIFLLAAILTPPDVTSQIMLGIPLYLLFEATLLAGRLMRREKLNCNNDNREPIC